MRTNGIGDQPAVLHRLKLQRRTVLCLLSIQYKSRSRNSECGAGDAVRQPVHILTVRGADRELCALWWATQDHRQHRGAAAHCEDPVAPGAHGAGAVPERAGGWGAGAAGAVLPAVNWTMSSDPVGR